MSPPLFRLRPLDSKDRAWVLDRVRRWGADFVISPGRKYTPPGRSQLPGGYERVSAAGAISSRATR